MKDIQNSLGYLLNTAARLIKGECNSKLQEYGITTSQWAVISDINTQEEKEEGIEAFLQIAIAQRLHSDRTTISQVIDKLEEKKLVIREKNSQDRRSFIVRITNEGKALVNRLEGLTEKIINEATKHLDQKEYDALIRSLNKIINDLSKNKGL